MIIRRASEREYELVFKYHPTTLARIKEKLPVRRYDWNQKKHFVPVSEEGRLRAFAKSYGWQFEDEIKPEMVIPDDIRVDMPDLDISIPLKRDLFPYQRQGVRFAIEKKRLIIGDKMGLGKTAQAIATITGAQAFPCLVICPSSLKINWEREWHMWTNHRAKIIDDSTWRYMDRWVDTNMIQVFIVNFESLKKYMVEHIEKNDEGKWTLRNVKFNRKINLFKSVIIDEAHKCKSFQTQATKFTKGICVGKEYILALTGTPVVNKPKDLVPQLGIIDRLNDLGGYKYFLQRYCGGFNEASNLKELNWRLNNTCFFSRNKEDVLKDLPAKMRQVVMCEIDDKHRHEYNECLADLGSYLSKYNAASDEQIQRSLRGEVMVRIGKLKDISARGKLAGGVKEFIEETIYDNQEKLVLFAHQHKVFDQLQAWFPEAVTITGRDSMEERQRSIDSFQNDEKCKLILCSIQAAGVGITLTASSRVSFVELGWHSAIHDQAEDRCHRIGQKDSVQCTYFIGRDTIDEWVFDIIEKKRSMVADITGGNLEAVEKSVVEDIIQLFNKKQEVAV